MYVQGSRLIIKHLYVERRLTPLDMYVRDAPPEQVQEIVIDYGKAVKDLAAANIFPGDIWHGSF